MTSSSLATAGRRVAVRPGGGQDTPAAGDAAPQAVIKFHAPEIVFGPGSLAEAGFAARRLGAERPFVVTDPGIIEAGWTVALTRHLADAGLTATVFWSELTPNRRTTRSRRATSASSSAMVCGLTATPDRDARTLTAREMEVLGLLARGLSNREISRALFIAETTAKFHVANIMRKLEVARRSEAVYVASQIGAL